MGERPNLQVNPAAEKSNLKAKFDKFMYEHGRKVATVSTLSRIPGGVLVAGLVLTDKLRHGQLTHGVFSGTDWIDGLGAKKSKEGCTERGGKLDQRVDKFFSGATELSLAVKGQLSKKHVAIRSGRDVVMSGVVRPYFERRGVDTSAVRSGKISTIAVTIADNFAMTKTAHRRPALNKVIQTAATGLKVYSAVQSSREWAKRKKETDKTNNAAA